MNTLRKKKAVSRKATSPLRLTPQEKIALQMVAAELGVSLSCATRLSILSAARRLKDLKPDILLL